MPTARASSQGVELEPPLELEPPPLLVPPVLGLPAVLVPPLDARPFDEPPLPPDSSSRPLDAPPHESGSRPSAENKVVLKVRGFALSIPRLCHDSLNGTDGGN